MTDSASPAEERPLPLHPDDGHEHSWGCRRCGVDPGPSVTDDERLDVERLRTRVYALSRYEARRNHVVGENDHGALLLRSDVLREFDRITVERGR